MASYIRDIDWSEYQSENDDDKGYDLYDQIEREDYVRYSKSRTRMGKYQGYQYEEKENE